jgi:hypothetical protein
MGGRCMTLIVVNISPSVYDIEATRSSLEFALQTGRIKNHVGVLPIMKKDPEEDRRRTEVFPMQPDGTSVREHERYPKNENDYSTIKMIKGYKIREFVVYSTEETPSRIIGCELVYAKGTPVLIGKKTDKCHRMFTPWPVTRIGVSDVR